MILKTALKERAAKAHGERYEMQGSLDNASPNWIQIAFGLLAAFVGGGGAFKLLTLWLSRKKLPAEIHESLARTDKTRAEARKINAQATSELDEIIERLHIRVDEMQLKVDEVRDDRDQYKLRCELQQIELKMRDDDIKKLKGILDAKGIKPSDFDEP